MLVSFKMRKKYKDWYEDIRIRENAYQWYRRMTGGF